MQNLFYVPPHQPRDTHKKPVDAHTGITRSSPERLDLNVPHPALDMGLITHGDTTPEPGLGPVIASAPRQGVRTWVGALLIRLGQKIAGDSLSPRGQPAF